MRHLLPKPLPLPIVKLLQVLEARRVLRDQRPLLQEGEDVLGEPLLLPEARDVLEKLVARDTL